MTVEKEVNPIALEYHWKYFFEYYGNDFKENQGTEVILDVLATYSIAGNWLDLGGGSNSYFWSAAMNKLSNITVIDKDIEAKIVTESIKKQQYHKGCFKYVMDRYKKTPNDIYNIPLQFIVGDLFNNPINMFTDTSYNTITQFGLWGLLKNKDKYISKLEEAYNKLSHGGVLIGANWIFEDPLIVKRGYDNKYLDIKMIEELSKERKYKLCFAKEIQIKDDPNYSKVIIYAIKENR